mmetsp:Transcript_11199/g.24716  ORF Transcript_11199/g.24716 Transcript_11199/m.24716 type:complete len:235 (+) Transcript_11199:102-806(+)
MGKQLCCPLCLMLTKMVDAAEALLVVALVMRLLVQSGGFLQQRHGVTDRLPRLDGKLEILQHELQHKRGRGVLPAGGGVGISVLQLRYRVVGVRGPAPSRGSIDHGVEQVHVDPKFSGKAIALRHPNHTDAKNQVVAELGRSTLARRPARHNVGTHAIQERLHALPFLRLFSGANHEGECASRRCWHASTNRSIHKRVPSLGRCTNHLQRSRRLDSAAIHDQLAPLGVSKNAVG